MAATRSSRIWFCQYFSTGNSYKLGFGGYTHIFWVKESNKTSKNNIGYFSVCSHLEFKNGRHDIPTEIVIFSVCSHLEFKNGRHEIPTEIGFSHISV